MPAVALHEAKWVQKRARTITFFVLTLLVAASIGVLLLAANSAHAATTFTVNQTSDLEDPGLNGVCDVNPFQLGKQCTLRAAIQEANATDGADLIRFNIAASGVQTIKPNSELPEITEAVAIDGYTQRPCSSNAAPCSKPNTNTTLAQGTNAKLLIELDGTNAGVGAHGLFIIGTAASNSVIRGLVINRFGLSCIAINGANSNRIEGNFIGTDPAGTRGRGNHNAGVGIGGGSNNTIGGTTRGARNVISGTVGEGISLNTVRASKIQGNFIGTDKNGETFGLYGNTGAGVLVEGTSSGSIIGDNDPNDAADASNIIAGNGGDGVVILDSDSTGYRLLRNSIFSNGDLGIDLANDGPTANDGGTANDADAGPNGLQNKPVLTSTLTSGSTTTIEGVLDTKPESAFTIEFFSNGNGNEGKKFIGRKRVPTDADGRVTFTFSPNSAVAAGEKITATATGPEGTSEFSAPRVVTAS